MTRPNIAIVGTHSATKRKAPYDDSAWEIWASSPANENDLPRVDVWFEMHKPFRYWHLNEYREWLASRPVLYMQEPIGEFPGSLTYPRDEIEARFGSHFLTSTASFMLALAITKEPEKIGIWGIEGRDEYGAQLAGLRHFLHLARDNGIEVVCPTRVLNPTPVYGYDDREFESEMVCASRSYL